MFIRGWSNGGYCEFYTDNPAYLEKIAEMLTNFEYGIEGYEENK